MPIFNWVAKKNYDIFAVLFSFTFTLAATLVSLNRFWQYEIFYYDFGIFDRAIWLVSRFQPPVIDHLVIGGKIIFADHFSPGIFLFSPLYFLTDKAEILLIAQAVCVGLSGFVIYKTGKIILNNSFLSLSVLISYFLFIGLQNAVISDFHETTVATLFLALTFYFFAKDKKLFTLIFFLLTLSFKESNFLLCAALAFCFLVLRKSWIKFSAVLFIISVVWGYNAIKIIIPFFAGGHYGYDISYDASMLNIFLDLLGSRDKINVVSYSFLSFGFLPVLAPAFYIVILQDFLARFLSNRVSLGLHYSALLSVLMGISTIYSFSFLQKIKFLKKFITFIAIILILNSIFLYRFVLHGPLALAYNKDFYTHTKDFRFLDDLVKKIPENVTVMTQNNIAPHLTHEKNIWILKDNYSLYKPDFIALDFREGQSANDFFPTRNPALVLQNILKDQNYSIYYKNGQQYIFKQKKF